MRARLILSSLLLASLAGCGGGSDFADLQSYMDEVRARPKGTNHRAVAEVPAVRGLHL